MTPNTPTPDYGEPWRPSQMWSTGYERAGAVAFDSNKHRDRIIACVNACAGMVDPAKEIKAMREAIKAAYKSLAYVSPTFGRTPAQAKPSPNSNLTPPMTPETDAQECSCKGDFSLMYEGAETSNVVAADFARRLERERDKARAALSGRTVSCPNCNEAGRTIEAMREAIREAITAINRLIAAAATGGSIRFGIATLAKLQPFITNVSQPSEEHNKV